MDIVEIDDAARWSGLVQQMCAHPQQTWEWGALKAATGPWRSRHLLAVEGGREVGGAQVLVRSMPFPFGEIAYAPRGPFALEGEPLGCVADALADWARANTRAMSLKIDPATTTLELSARWRPSERVLVRKTAVIDLAPDEDEIMRSIPNRKARQYIRKAARDGVTCRPGTAADLDGVLAMYKATAAADGFGIHDDAFYRTALTTLGDVGQLLVAERDGCLHAFLWNVLTRGTAFELWGAVTDEGKRSRANYLLKWSAIRAAKERGTRLYDLNGLLNDGISDFKLLFVREPTVWAGTFDRPLRPLYGAMNLALAARRRLQTSRSAQRDTSDS